MVKHWLVLEIITKSYNIFQLQHKNQHWVHIFVFIKDMLTKFIQHMVSSCLLFIDDMVLIDEISTKMSEKLRKMENNDRTKIENMMCLESKCMLNKSNGNFFSELFS